MPHPQIGQLAAGGVGHEPGQPIPINIVEPQLRTRMRTLAANDDPHPGRPTGQVEQPSEVGDTRQPGRDPRPAWSSASAITFWWSAAVLRSRVTGSQQDGQRFPGPLRAVIDERAQPVEPETCV